MPPDVMEDAISRTSPPPTANNELEKKKKRGRPKGSRNTNPASSDGNDENHKVDHPRRDRKTPDRFSQTGYSIRAGGDGVSKPRGRKAATAKAPSNAKLIGGRQRTKGKGKKGKLGGLQAEVEKMVDDALGGLRKKLAKVLAEYGH